MNIHILMFESPNEKSGYAQRVAMDISFLQSLGHLVSTTVVKAGKISFLANFSTTPRATRKFAPHIKEVMSKIKGVVDLLIIQGVWLAEASKYIDVPWILVEHNLEYRNSFLRAQMEKNILKKWIYYAIAYRTQQYEYLSIVEAPVVITVSDVERKILDSERLFSFMVPLISYLKRMQPIDAETRSGVLMLGTWDYEPNRVSLSWFLEYVLPLIRGRGVKLNIVGRKLDLDLSEYGQDVIYHGQVENVERYLSESTCLVVPLKMGAGVRMKILDAWQVGCPVVSTQIGADGLDADNYENIILADDPQEIAGAVLRLQTDRQLVEKLVMGGWHITDEKYSTKQYADSWTEAIGRAVGFHQCDSSF